MSTLLEIKTAAAGILDVAVADFTVGGIDLWLLFANQVRQKAEFVNDFEFSRKEILLTVNGATGGDLVAAVDLDGNPVTVKTVIEVGTVDGQGNVRPAEWTTVAEGMERQRQGYRGVLPRYPTDAQAIDGCYGPSRFTFSGNKVRIWPKLDATNATNYTLYMEVYSFYPDWVGGDLYADTVTVSGTLSPDATGTYTFAGLHNGYPYYVRTTAYILFHNGIVWVLQDGNSFTPSMTSLTGTATITAPSVVDIWTTYGQQFLLWSTVILLNQRFKNFVPRQEGNLPPPQQLADEGLQQLIEWDATKYEQFRRHNR